MCVCVCICVCVCVCSVVCIYMCVCVHVCSVMCVGCVCVYACACDIAKALKYLHTCLSLQTLTVFIDDYILLSPHLICCQQLSTSNSIRSSSDISDGISFNFDHHLFDLLVSHPPPEVCHCYYVCLVLISCSRTDINHCLWTDKVDYQISDNCEESISLVFQFISKMSQQLTTIASSVMVLIKAARFDVSFCWHGNADHVML